MTTPTRDAADDADAAVRRRTAWMYEGKLGLTTHYFPRQPEEVDEIAEQFDVERVATQCEEAGAQWHLWPHLGPWWGSGGVRFDDRELCAWAQGVVRGGGVMSFEVGTRGLTKSGRQDTDPVRDGPVGAIDPRQVAQVAAVAAAIRDA